MRQNFRWKPLVSHSIGSWVIIARRIEVEQKKTGKTIVHSKTVALMNSLSPTTESRISPQFPVITNFERGIFACREKKNEDILAKQVCKCFIWATSLGTIHGEGLPNYFLPTQTIKVEVFFQWWLAFKSQHKSTKKVIQTSWLQTNFAVDLWPWISILPPTKRWYHFMPKCLVQYNSLPLHYLDLFGTLSRGRQDFRTNGWHWIDDWLTI